VLCPGPLQNLSLGRPDNGLNFRRVNETGDIRIVDLGSRKEVVFLLDRSFVESAENFVKGSERALGPDNETAQMTTRSKLQKVEAADIANFNTGEIAESLDDAVILSIDNEGTTTLTVTSVPHFTFTGAKFPRVGDLGNIGVGVEALEESNSFLGLLEGLGGATDNERNFLNLLNAMSTGEDKRGKSRSGKSRNNSETALVLVDLDVPFPPSLSGSEHTTTTAHVTESSLSRTVGTSSTYTGNTGNSTPGTPRLGTRLVASFCRDSIWLTTIFGNGFVDLLYDVQADRCCQNIREREGLGGLYIIKKINFTLIITLTKYPYHQSCSKR
jgi:hypothetical protein